MYQNIYGTWEGGETKNTREVEKIIENHLLAAVVVAGYSGGGGYDTTPPTDHRFLLHDLDLSGQLDRYIPDLYDMYD